MPQEIRGKVNVKINPHALRSRAKLATHIGIIASMWSEIEEELVWLYVTALRTTPAVAAATLEKVFSLAIRLDMTRSALQLRYTPEVLKRFNALAETVKTRSRERNSIVHAMWTVHRNHPGALIRLAGITDPKLRIDKYALRDFVEIEMRLLQLQIDLRLFAQSLGSSLPLSDEEERERFWRLTGPSQDRAADQRRKRRTGSSGRVPSQRPRPKLQPVR